MKGLLFAILLLTVQAAFAEGLANIWENVPIPKFSNIQSHKAPSDDSALAARNSDTVLTPDAAQWLYGMGHIPRVEDTDRFYDAGHTTGLCKAKWDAMRHPRPPIYPIGVKAPLEKLEENARRAGLPLRKLHRALGVYLANQTEIPEQEYISVVDYDKPGSQNRWFFINLMTGKITSQRVSAGKGSDPSHSGNASLFSDTEGTNASSLGCAIVSGHVNSGKHGPSMLVHGLEDSNRNSCGRMIEVHAPLKWGGRYRGFYKAYDAGNGRSNGCLTVNDRDGTFKKLGSGGLVCSYKDGPHGVATHVHGRAGHRYSHYRKGKRRHHRRHYRHRRYYVRYSY